MNVQTRSAIPALTSSPLPEPAIDLIAKALARFLTAVDLSADVRVYADDDRKEA